MSKLDYPKPPFMATASWIMYDFANTAYSMNIVSLYFSTWIVIELAQSDFWVSLVNSVSMLLVALTMPVLGEWSDKKNKKMSALLIFTLVCILGTMSMGFVGKNIQTISILVPFVLSIYVISNYCYQGGLVFYNALLPSVSTPKTLGRISGYGVAIGYLGSAAGLFIGGLFVDGSSFGLTIPGIEAGGRVAAFIPTALLFLVCAIPIFIFVKEPKTVDQDAKWNVKSSYKRVWRSIKNTKQHPGLLRFLVAKFLYEDSIQTVVIFMGVYTQAVMGFSSAETTQFFVMIIPAAVLGSVICGVMTDHYGPKRTLVVVIVLWLISLSIVIATLSTTVFWFVGASVGILLGSTWTAARPLLITLAPANNLGEFFGLYALSGKVAAILGPLLWSAVTFSLARFGPIVKYKSAIGVLALVMVIGLVVLIGVPDFHRQAKFGNVEKG
jgi:MFS transporter, UMF1 family